MRPGLITLKWQTKACMSVRDISHALSNSAFRSWRCHGVSTAMSRERREQEERNSATEEYKARLGSHFRCESHNYHFLHANRLHLIRGMLLKIIPFETASHSHLGDLIVALILEWNDYFQNYRSYHKMSVPRSYQLWVLRIAVLNNPVTKKKIPLYYAQRGSVCLNTHLPCCQPSSSLTQKNPS